MYLNKIVNLHWYTTYVSVIFVSRSYFLRHQRICFAHNFGTAWKVRKVWHTIKVFQFPIGHNIEGIWQQLARCGLLAQVQAPIVGNHGLHSLHTVQSGWIQEYFFTSLYIGFKNGYLLRYVPIIFQILEFQKFFFISRFFWKMVFAKLTSDFL